MFTAAEIKALETCIDIADPDEAATPEQFAIIEAAYAAVKRAREEHRKIANATLQALAMHLEDQKIWLAKRVTIHLDPSNMQDEERRLDPFKLFAKFLRDTYAHPNDLPDFDEQDRLRQEEENNKLHGLLNSIGAPRWKSQHAGPQLALSMYERVEWLYKQYKGIRTSLDEALNSGDGTYRP